MKQRDEQLRPTVDVTSPSVVKQLVVKDVFSHKASERFSFVATFFFKYKLIIFLFSLSFTQGVDQHAVGEEEH